MHPASDRPFGLSGEGLAIEKAVGLGQEAAAGAVPMDEWTVFRLTDEALRDFTRPRAED